MVRPKDFTGTKITPEIKEKMDSADILVFLFSMEFLDSAPCIEEWEYAKHLADEGKLIFRIPIILKDCPWKNFLGEDNTKVLPDKGFPVVKFDHEDTAWLQVYEGIKLVIDQLRHTFSLKSEFTSEIEKTGFLSLEHVNLQDIFVFPTLSYFPPQAKESLLTIETIEDRTELLGKKNLLIHGSEMSGKTALGIHLFLTLAKDELKPVLYIDLEEVPSNPSEVVFSNAYYYQFDGDYAFWLQQEDKTLILDNLTPAPNAMKLIELARTYFNKIIITLSSDVYYSFFRDESRLTDFDEVLIEPLNHKQQEILIRKRLKVSDRNQPISDGLVDHIEDRINSIIISDRIVPRYPFFVLSILQTYEGFMPDNMSITSYGHCYNALIVANLIKAGISSEDNDINSCYNFAEVLAFEIFKDKRKQGPASLNFENFIKKYRIKYVVSDSILSRLKKDDYGIIKSDGCFRTPYMYYFFLARYLSRTGKDNEAIINELCEQSHLPSNYLTILFIIHHTNDNKIIEDILVRTMCTLDSIYPAVLNQEETDGFRDIVNSIPMNIMRERSREEGREKERDIRDIKDDLIETEDDVNKENDEDSNEIYLLNDIYRILKNNEIMGQILRNRYGSLEKDQIKEIIEIVADSGLRLVKLLLVDEECINAEADFLQKKFPNHSTDKIKKFLQYLLFLWAMGNVRKIVNSINVPEIRDLIKEVVQERSTPAYDLIGYFNHLYSVEKLTNGVKRDLETLLKKHDDYFLHRVLSLETQYYMNTHRSKSRLEQSICSLLNIEYTYKHKP